jgi:hypothetical protein
MDNVLTDGVLIRSTPPSGPLQRGPWRAVEKVVEEAEREGLGGRLIE